MQTIRKINRPIHFDKWVDDNTKNGNLSTWKADNALKGQDIWNKIGKGAYKNAKEILIKDQKAICCYCGTPINIRTSDIEHLKPQGIYRDLIFDYDRNHFATCMSGREPIYHIVKENETLSEITKKYQVEENKITKYIAHNQTLEMIDLKRKPLKKGDKLHIFPVLPKGIKHCNNSKGSQEIPFDLHDPNLFSYFDFIKQDKDNEEEDDGTMFVKKDIEILSNGKIKYEDAHNAINKTLNLNCDFLKARRKALYDSITIILPEDVENFIDELRNEYLTPNEFIGYVFVAIYKINLIDIP